MNAFVNVSAVSRAPRGATRLNRVSASVLRFGGWLREASRRSAVINELDRLSDRELADIGITRGDIRSVFAVARRAG
jgi:uncharacterized protein YjiS (DUF1127 family)